jgi:hypothetical protein
MNIKKFTTEEFMIKSKSIFGDIYDYCLCIYNGSNKKVNLICKQHGEFSQLAFTHLLGRHGCKQCKNINRAKTISQFIKDAVSIFGDRYDYSYVVYNNAYSKIKILCKIHGIFLQVAHYHLSGNGCQKCKADTISFSFRKSLEKFIMEANLVHHNKYDYSKSIYINSQTKLIIICYKHGEFEQTPSNHLNEHGCSKCSISNTSKLETLWLDSLNIPQKYRQKCIKINNKLYKLDAYDPNTNTIYEFYGDYWHGNPAIYQQDKLNEIRKMAYGKLYNNTLEREINLINAGYNVISVWELDIKNNKNL